MNSPGMRMDQGQSQAMTPRLQRAVRLLQLSALEYEQELHDLMAVNPFLDLDDSAPLSHAASELPMAPDPADVAGSLDAADKGEADTASIDDGRDWEEREPLQHSSGSTNHDGSGASQTSATDLLVSHGDLHQYLRHQLSLLRLSLREHALVCLVIDAIDDDGYCRAEMAELDLPEDFDPPVGARELTSALSRVQAFDPPGVGARSVGECLLLQMEKIDAAHRDLAQRIASDHLDRLAQRDVPALAKLLGCSVDEADAACAALRRLDPRPGWQFSRPDTRYVLPDVVVRKVRGQWIAHLNGDVVPRLRLNRSCAELFKRHRTVGHRELTAHLQEARWTLRNVEQRFETILAVSRAILRRQRLFFEHGPLAMKPLALRDIADEVGVHESTVCRVTNNKYMSTPCGLFELKHFFSRAIPMASGGACSATAIRGVVKELIDTEDPCAPLSDVDITQRLERQGLKVARRTVTKYRQGMKIAPADRRRRHVQVNAGSGLQPAGL